MNLSLKQLSPGDRAVVKQVTAKGQIRRRIVDMGVVPGVEVEMERSAPLGDPVEIKIDSYHLALRKEEADAITVELLSVV
ncbi:MAG: ferrous iron transport protein A [Syntrophomonadaceae bacterium]|nr:ferrous iron transport protein A [Syntrophomonadaceae bacterium]